MWHVQYAHTTHNWTCFNVYDIIYSLLLHCCSWATEKPLGWSDLTEWLLEFQGPLNLHGEYILWKEFKQCNHHPSYSQSHQVSLWSKELEQTLVCWLIRMHAYRFLSSICWLRFHIYISIIPSQFHNASIKKQRATTGLCKPNEIVSRMMDGDMFVNSLHSTLTSSV